MTTFTLQIDRSALPSLQSAVDAWSCVGARIVTVEDADCEHKAHVRIDCDDASTAYYIGYKRCNRTIAHSYGRMRL